ncbi:PREDICTED: proSAAS [Chinchilla lanigera]|uniref:proSAAS n=1 Tax=Chinchilla lanigera TaxID=34839 RepID=UPI00038F0523|nr:PREDICTED: proSAAS [Chinchilla lanigera]
MAGSPLLRGPRAGGVGLLVLLLLGLLRLPPALCARPVKEPRSLSAAPPAMAEAGPPRPQLAPAPAPAAAHRPRPPVYDDGPTGPDTEDTGDETPDVDPELLRYLLGRILTGSAEPEAGAAPRRLRRAADQELGPEAPPEGVLGALLRVKRLENSPPPAPARRLLPP